MSDAELEQVGARWVIADADRGFPCRIGLRDVGVGERVILLNYVSHDVAGPFRTAYAIYVGEQSQPARPFIDTLPDYLGSRALSLRAFDTDGLIVTAVLARPGESDAAVRKLFADERVAYIMAHFAAFGCFGAKIERHQEKGGAA
jgi:hypothetical protein